MAKAAFNVAHKIHKHAVSSRRVFLLPLPRPAGGEISSDKDGQGIFLGVNFSFLGFWG